MKSQVVEDFGDKFALFEKNDPLWGNLQNEFCSERIHHDTDPRLVCKLREIWPTGNR